MKHFTQATDLPLLENLSENFVRFLSLVFASVLVYGTSLVILVKYFGADLQRRNDKFERTILVNLSLAALEGISNAKPMLRKDH